jgi:DNA-directed RNA polymerase subunit K/omega
MPSSIEKLIVIEKITKKVKNRYEAVRVIAMEARRLNSLIIRGAEADPDYKPTTAALTRLINDKINYEFNDEETGSGDFFEE